MDFDSEERMSNYDFAQSYLADYLPLSRIEDYMSNLKKSEGKNGVELDAPCCTVQEYTAFH